MPNRILKDSICTSPNIDALSRDAEVFFYRLLVQCDDFGRMDARTPILRAKCYPLQVDTVTQDDVKRWLNELVAVDLVIIYTVDGGDYIQMKTWERHQQIRAKRSKYPDMKSSDINCNQVQSDAPVIQSNPIQSEPVAPDGEGGSSVNGTNGRYGARQSKAAYHTQEAQKLGVNAETFRAITDKLIDAAGWRALVNDGQNDRNLVEAKDRALELVRMGVTTVQQVDSAIDGYKTANKWRSSPPQPRDIVAYASQSKQGIEPKPAMGDRISDSDRHVLNAWEVLYQQSAGAQA